MAKEKLSYPKILFLDIETAPNLATVWDIWNQNIGVNQLLESSYILCWSAKWIGSKNIMFDSVKKSGKDKVVKSIWKLLDEADIIIHYNGRRFDIPTLNKEFLLRKMFPPSPYKQIDLYPIFKKKFKFISNKLAYISKQLGFKGKIKTDHKLWLDCMNGDETAWKKMEAYNKRDIIELEKVYKEVLPWIDTHPNIGSYTESNKQTCSNCGSDNIQRKGTYRSKTLVYKKFQCKDCGTWLKSRTPEKVQSPHLTQTEV